MGFLVALSLALLMLACGSAPGGTGNATTPDEPPVVPTATASKSKPALSDAAVLKCSAVSEDEIQVDVQMSNTSTTPQVLTATVVVTVDSASKTDVVSSEVPIEPGRYLGVLGGVVELHNSGSQAPTCKIKSVDYKE